MKTLLVILLSCVLSITVNAQTDNDYLEVARDVLKTEKKAVIAEAMDLSEEESTVFWPLYNEYQGKLYLVQNKRIAIIKDFAMNYESLSDEKADELYTGALAYQSELLKLEKSYYKKFKKIIAVGKAARFFQLENKIETLIDAELAMELPLIEVK